MGMLKKLIDRLFGEKADAGNTQPGQEVSSGPKSISQRMAAPKTAFAPTFGPPPGKEEPTENLIFDPATQQFSHAFRRGDPTLAPDEMQRWHEARREVMWRLLDISTWRLPSG